MILKRQRTRKFYHHRRCFGLHS